MTSQFIGYAKLMRPANLPTAAADIMAGIAIAGFFEFGVVDNMFICLFLKPILFLVVSSICLYAGGVVLNDVFDFELDKMERPERPIPSGIVPLKSAMIFGIVLLLAGVVFSFLATNRCGLIAIALAMSIALYDGFSKKYAFLGPMNMGICRGLNLILGMSLFGLKDHWWFAVVPITYIFAITLISRGEVHGKNKGPIIVAAGLYAAVIFTVLAIAYLNTENTMMTLLFLFVFALLILRPLVKAYRINSPENIKNAVVAGVLSLIVLDASIAVGFSTWWYGLGIVILLPISILLSKLFAVT